MQYNPEHVFPLNSVINHSSYGEGKVITHIYPNKMEVEFPSGTKRLICGILSDSERQRNIDADAYVKDELSTNSLPLDIEQRKNIKAVFQQSHAKKKSVIRSAVAIKQGIMTLYTTSLQVRHVMSPDFCTVEQLDPENINKRGYQRLLDKKRAKEFADYMIDAQGKEDAFLPTSIFMATDKDIPFDKTSNTIEIIQDEVCPLNIVDGQHRVEGLRLAAQKDAQILDFEFPVTIAVNLSEILQMYHFFIVNTKQKKVDESIEQRIKARLSQLIDIADTFTLPKQLQRSILAGDDASALEYLAFLNMEQDSPWKGKIKMANDNTRGHSVTQKSFVNAIKRYVLVYNNPVKDRYSQEQQHRMFLNYWIALTNIIGKAPATLFKSLGVDLFCRFYVHFLSKLDNIASDFTIETMQSLLERVFESVDGDAAGVGYAEFWEIRGKAGTLNSGGFGKINAEMVTALNNISAYEKKKI